MRLMLKDKALKYIFIISISIAITFPLINIYLIYPSFTRLFIENVMLHSFIIPFVMMFSFVAVIMIILFKLDRNITERKSTEEALKRSNKFSKTVLNSMNDAISIIDVRNFTIVRVNSVFLKEVGLKEEEVIGKRCYEITHHRSDPCTPPDDICPLLDTVATGKHAIAEHVHYTKNSEKIYVEVSTSSIIDENGEIIQVVHVARDITDRKLAEEKLKTFAAKLEQSNIELQNILSVTSHDLQEPLRKVQIFGDRLKAKSGEALNDQGREYLERMQDAAGRMQGLINALVSYTRVATKAQPFVPVDLATVAQEVLSDLEVHIEQIGGRVEVADLPIIETDPIQMHQLLQNLIGNALKFHHNKKPPAVKIHGHLLKGQERSLAGSAAFNGLCQITVEDNGIGFDEKYAERIFGVFQRLHGRNEYEGTGIGLAVCRRIVEHHGGSIKAKSTPGQGAAFIITLPVKQPLTVQPPRLPDGGQVRHPSTIKMSYPD